MNAVHAEELRVDQGRIREEPLVVVDLVELSELGPELTHGRLEVAEHVGELLELVEEEEGFLDARLVLFEGEEHGELQRELGYLAAEREIEAREVEALVMPISD